MERERKMSEIKEQEVRCEPVSHNICIPVHRKTQLNLNSNIFGLRKIHKILLAIRIANAL